MLNNRTNVRIYGLLDRCLFRNMVAGNYTKQIEEGNSLRSILSIIAAAWRFCQLPADNAVCVAAT